MALLNWGYLHSIEDTEKFFFSANAKKEKKKGYGPFKNSGEQSRAILVLLLNRPTYSLVNFCYYDL